MMMIQYNFGSVLRAWDIEIGLVPNGSSSDRYIFGSETPDRSRDLDSRSLKASRLVSSDLSVRTSGDCRSRDGSM